MNSKGTKFKGQKKMERNNNLEPVISIRLSHDGVSIWRDDMAEQSKWDTLDMSLVSSSSSQELLYSFDKQMNTEDNIRSILALEQESRGELTGRKIIYLDTQKWVLVPSRIYKNGSEEHYLEINNLMPTEGVESIYITRSLAQTIGIVAWDEQQMNLLKELLGEFTIASPLQYNLLRQSSEVIKSRSEITVVCYLSPSRIYLAVLKQLSSTMRVPLMIDSFPLDSNADIVYYLNGLDKIFQTRSSPHLIKGHNCIQVTELLGEHFKSTRCG